MDEIYSSNKINIFSKETPVHLLKQSFQSICKLPVKLKRTGETKHTMTEVAQSGSYVRKMIIRIPSDEGTVVTPDPDFHNTAAIKRNNEATTNRIVKATI